jgi:hypothetical protein
LLIKHRDEYATTRDVVANETTSVATGRTMDDIAAGKKRVASKTANKKATARRSR